MSDSDWHVNANTWQKRYPTTEMQAEFFLLKFNKDGDVSRGSVFDLLNQFNKFDKRAKGELEEDEAMMLLEARNSTKTFTELRAMVAEIDYDKNRRLSFLEWCCAIYNKDWKTLHSPSVDPEEIKQALELQAQAEEQLNKAAAQWELSQREDEEKKFQSSLANMNAEQAAAAKSQHERELADRDAAIKAKKEAEQAAKKAALAQAGVKGAAAKFHYAAKDTADTTMDNASRIKAEAAGRKEKKRLEAENVVAAQAAEKAEREAAAALVAKQAADQEKKIAEQAAAIALEAKKKAESGHEIAEAERIAYETSKQLEVEEKAAKKAAEDADRATRRAKLAEKASLWNNK
jgi:hypothetical protein